MGITKCIHISDTIHGTIKLNQIEKEIISTQIFNRLHNIAQNSTVYLTFPTNRTKRFEHSIGTMKLCGKIFQDSISNTDEDTLNNFFMSIQNVIDENIDVVLRKYPDRYRSKIGDRNLDRTTALKYKEIEVLDEYNNFIPINVPKEYISTYTILFESIRLSGLLHDVGHPPFSHITEFALKDIWNSVQAISEENRTDRQKNFISCMNNYFLTKQDLHEQIGNKITAKVLDDIVHTIPAYKVKDSNYVMQQLFRIIVVEVTSAILQEKLEVFGELHRIIDGTLDGDRLDYVSRDPINSGLDVGKIEYNRIIDSMRLTENEGNHIFTPSAKVIDSLDDFFNRRWRMYKQIIYHHRVIKTDYLLQDCIKELALTYLESTEPDDNCVNVLPYNISGLWKAIEDKASHTHFFDTLIQWDDGWLLTILKVHYFNNYSTMQEPSIVGYKLEELLANKKNYFSLIKRMQDFVTIDEEVARVFYEEYNNIKQLANKKPSGDQTGASDSVTTGKVAVNLDPVLGLVNRFVSQIEASKSDYKKIFKNGFLLCNINKIFSNLFESDWLSDIIKEAVTEIVQSNDDIQDSFVVIKKVKTGIPGGSEYLSGGLGVYMFSNDDVSVIDYTHISNISSMLQDDADFMPAFYMYILKAREDIDYDKIKKFLGKCIGNKIASKIKDTLNKLTS